MTTTHKRKLRTDGTLWQHMRAPRVPHRALTRDTSTEVLIVGAGITGAMIADALAEAGLDTIIVDRRPPTLGSTVASTALVAYEIDMPLSELQGKIGKRDATRAWRRSRLAVANLQSYFAERELEAQSRCSLYLAGNELGVRDLKVEGELRRAAGIETAFLDRAALRARFGIDHGGRAARARQSHRQPARGDRALVDPGREARHAHLFTGGDCRSDACAFLLDRHDEGGPAHPLQAHRVRERL